VSVLRSISPIGHRSPWEPGSLPEAGSLNTYRSRGRSNW
jgi:hypothetical protein